MGASANSQNNEQMQKYIMNTHTKQTCLQVMPFLRVYTTEEGTFHESFLFKNIMRINTIVNRVTAAVLTDNLHNLDAKMVELHNFFKFHFYIHILLQALLVP